MFICQANRHSKTHCTQPYKAFNSLVIEYRRKIRVFSTQKAGLLSSWKHVTHLCEPACSLQGKLTLPVIYLSDFRGPLLGCAKVICKDLPSCSQTSFPPSYSPIAECKKAVRRLNPSPGAAQCRPPQGHLTENRVAFKGTGLPFVFFMWENKNDLVPKSERKSTENKAEYLALESYCFQTNNPKIQLLLFLTGEVAIWQKYLWPTKVILQPGCHTFRNTQDHMQVTSPGQLRDAVRAVSVCSSAACASCFHSLGGSAEKLKDPVPMSPTEGRSKVAAAGRALSV